MARLKAIDRAKLPDSAFAYVDSSGKRRLPIHDEAHVRNALGRFERVSFESDAVRERACTRLLNAATAARVCQAAHGGQTIVSGRTRDAARDSMPAGVRLRSLGWHRLAALPRAEALFQVEAEGLPAEFPPLRTDAES